MDTQLVPRTSVLGNDLLLLKLLDGFPRNFRAIKNRKLEVAMKTGRNGAPGLLRSSAVAARIADQHLVLHHQGRHPHGLAEMDIAELIIPEFLPGRGVDLERVAVERVVKDAAIGERRAAVDGIAAGNALGGRFGPRA